MNIAKRCPARSNQLSAAAKQQPAENNKQRESDDGDDGGDGYTKQNGRTMRKQREHSDDDPDCDSNGTNGAGVDKHSDNGGDRQQKKCKLYPKKSYEKRWPHCNLEDDKAVTQAPATSFQQQPNDIQQYTKSSDEAVAAMTATTATQTKTDGQCANGADTVRMTPAATPVVQTALALKPSVTTMRKDCTALQRSEQQSCATMQVRTR